jgi:hypothetical protein
MLIDLKMRHLKQTPGSFREALAILEEGWAVASGKWRMQHNDENELLVGKLTEDGD